MSTRTVGVGLAVVAIGLGACTGTPTAPTHTPDEREAICERGGGRWQPNILDGYCEPNSHI
jgi:hypothetical protein